MRVYTVCNVAVMNTDNWLYMPYIARSAANRIYIQMQFTIRGCANYRDPINLQQCKVFYVARCMHCVTGLCNH